MIPEDISIKKKLFTKVYWKLIPMLFCLYILSYIDRVNVGFAQLGMKSTLHFSDAVYGLGAGIFFLGYTLFEIPSNLILHKVGARKWIGRIMISWGIVSVCMAFVKGETSFYILRFLLGAAEAGFFPGIILYLHAWFPFSQRAKAVALFMTATAIAGLVGGPLAGVCLSFDKVYEFEGWQWLFVLEGIPTVIAGGLVYFFLKDNPLQVKWLSPVEVNMLKEQIAIEEPVNTSKTLKGAFANYRIWLLGFVYFSTVVSLYAIGFWLPLLLKNFNTHSNTEIGFLSAIPYLFATVAMVWVGRHSDLTGERKWHLIISAWFGAAGLALSTQMTEPISMLVCLSVSAAGIWSTLGPFWSLPSRYISGPAAAAGIALINSLGNFGGFVGNDFVGRIKTSTGDTDLALLCMAGLMAIGSLTVLFLKTEKSSVADLRRCHKRQ